MKNILILIFSLFSMVSFSQVHAWEIIQFSQGTNHLGGTVIVQRSDTQKALGAPQINNSTSAPINFVSLGFNGELILKIEESFIITPTSIMTVYETTNGFTACNTYPEKADIYISDDNENYVYLGQQCINNNNIFNLYDSGLEEFSYIKIIDVSDITYFTRFNFTSDGFDVDGITITDNGILPIVLKSFNIIYSDDILNVKFITASEQNTFKFEVEYSNDLINFYTIIEIPAYGNSSTDRLYEKRIFFDPVNNVTYFRLVEIDYNNNIFKFDIIPVNTRLNTVERHYFDILGRRVNKGDDILIFKK